MRKLWFFLAIYAIVLNSLSAQKSSYFHDFESLPGEQVSDKFLLKSRDFPAKSVNVFVVRTRKDFQIRIYHNFGHMDLTPGDEIWFVNKEGGSICYTNTMENQERLFATRLFNATGAHIGNLLKIVLHGESYYFDEKQSIQFFQVLYEAEKYLQN